VGRDDLSVRGLLAAVVRNERALLAAAVRDGWRRARQRLRPGLPAGPGPAVRAALRRAYELGFADGGLYEAGRRDEGAPHAP
jgi:DNA invertase Pin-like site-specific DNA recombinase